MKKIKTLTLIIFCVALHQGFYSCDFLNAEDYYFNETLQVDSIFSNKRNLEKYLWGMAAYLPDEGSVMGFEYTPGCFATDEGFSLGLTSEFRGMAFVLGEITPSNLYYMDIWGAMYKVIRKANTILARMGEAGDLTAVDKSEITAYTLFMRAYAYYHLLMQYGPVILLGDNILENNEPAEYYNTHRSTYDQSVEYMRRA